MQKKIKEKVYTIKKIAENLGLCRATIYNRISAMHPEFIFIPANRFYSEEEFNFIKEKGNFYWDSNIKKVRMKNIRKFKEVQIPNNFQHLKLKHSNSHQCANCYLIIEKCSCDGLLHTELSKIKRNSEKIIEIISECEKCHKFTIIKL